jgi:hypothetical protein
LEKIAQYVESEHNQRSASPGFTGSLSLLSFDNVIALFLSAFMKHALTAILLILLFPYGAAGAGCASMTKELQALRLEYRTHTAGASGGSVETSFDSLVKILDRIVEIKSAMRKANCKIPPRTNSR